MSADQLDTNSTTRNPDMACPFCGAQPYTGKNGKHGEFFVIGCEDCEIDFWDLDEDAVHNRWNRRALNV